MADILSLSAARKRKARAGKEQQAAENRIKFGRTKTERQKDTAQKAKLEREIEAHKLKE